MCNYVHLIHALDLGLDLSPCLCGRQEILYAATPPYRHVLRSQRPRPWPCQNDVGLQGNCCSMGPWIVKGWPARDIISLKDHVAVEHWKFLSVPVMVPKPAAFRTFPILSAPPPFHNILWACMMPIIRVYNYFFQDLPLSGEAGGILTAGLWSV